MTFKTQATIRLVFNGEPDGQSEIDLELNLSEHLDKLSDLTSDPDIWVHIWGAKDWNFRRWVYAYGQHGNRIVEQFRHVKFIEHTNDSEKLSRARGNNCVDFAYDNYFYAKTDLEKPLI
jgi:hypothetical protein